MAPYLRRDPRRAVWQIATSVIPYGVGWWLMYESLSVSFALTLLLAIPTAGFLVRSFVVVHDCAHGSFFASRRANVWAGCALALLACTPFHEWRRRHKLHHATSNDLSRRGWWDIETLTTREYLELSPLRRLAYRVYRNPIFLFGVAPLAFFLVVQRFAAPGARARHHASVMATNLVLAAAVLLMTRWLGAGPFLSVQLPIWAIAASAALWLFYVQHQFEDSRWADPDHWTFERAALEGSSFYELPAVLRWFTGSIGYHHVHHLCPRIPNYRLKACHDAHPPFRDVPTLTLRTSGSALRARLWDENAERMVGFDAVRSASARPSSALGRSLAGPLVDRALAVARPGLVRFERAWNGLPLPRLADVTEWIPLVGSFGGSVVARHPAVADPALGRSMSRILTVTRIVVDDRRRIPAGVGREVKRRLFPGEPGFLLNVFFACGADGYSDPDSPWFNVFYGGYEIVAPRSSWSRPFGYTEGPDPRPLAEEIRRLGEADWNYFSNHLAGAPLETLPTTGASSFRDLGRHRLRSVENVADGGRFWDEIEIDGVEVVSTHRSTRDGGRFRDPSRFFSPLWRFSFGVSRPRDSALESFAPVRMRARLYASCACGRSARYGDVFRTFVLGATVPKRSPEDPGDERFLRLQLGALEELARSQYPQLGFPEE